MTRLRSTYFIVANTAILILLVEGGSHLALKAYQRWWPRFSYGALSEPVRRNYAHLSQADVDDLWRVTLALRFRYAPAVGLVQDRVASKFVNIDEYGVRSNGNGHRPFSAMQGATWFLGGSTTLGYGIADGETIPARLEAALARPVMNLGVRGHAAPAENRQLALYLRAGFRPAAAVFLDGINESCDAEQFDNEFGMLVSNAQDGYTRQFGHAFRYAFALLSHAVQRRLGLIQTPPDRLQVTCVTNGQGTALRTIHARHLAERAALCRLYEVDCRTFVQPFAGVHGRHDDPSSLSSDEEDYFRRLYAQLEPSFRDAGATFLTGALDRSDRHAFVDSAHYSAEASRLIAEAMAVSLRTAAATTAGRSAAHLWP